MQTFWLQIFVLFYALFLSFLHYFFEKLSSRVGSFHDILLSFGAGTLLSTIFLILLPEAVHSSPTLIVYPLILVGYVVFLILEKYLYQHVKDPVLLEEELYHLHAGGFFADHFIKGFILVAIVELEPILGFLTAIPFLIHTLSSSIALKEIHSVSERALDRVLLSAAPLVGALVGLLMDIGPNMERYFLAFVSGLMLFLVSRDIMPKEKEGRPLFFLLGLFVIFLIWLGLAILIP